MPAMLLSLGILTAIGRVMRAVAVGLIADGGKHGDGDG